LQESLQRVRTKFFSDTTKAKSVKHASFKNKYKAAFDRDFMFPQGSDQGSSASATQVATMTMDQLIHRLKRWKRALLVTVKRMPAQLRMEDCSRRLVAFPSSGLEVPGQYSATTTPFDCEPNTTAHVRLVRFGAEVDVVHRQGGGSAQRRLSMRGDDGRGWRFLVQVSERLSERASERVSE
jgi:hypothetical protein